MRIVLLTICAFIFHYPAFSQKEESKVSFVAYWSLGDKYEFKITKKQQQWKGETLARNDSSQYLVNFEVIGSTDDSYKIKWSYKNGIASNYNIPENLRSKFAKYEMTDVIYTTSELGQFVGIENWEEIGKMMKGLFADLTEVMGDEKNNKAELQKVMEPLVAIYESKQGIEQLIFKELQFFHFPFGFELNVKEPIEYVDELPNMAGGDPIKGDAKISFESVDFTNGHCVFNQHMKLNPEDARAAIQQLLVKMSLKDNEVQKAMATAKLEITDNNRYEYFYNPGVPIKLETKRETIIDINKEVGRKIEVIRIELVH